MVNNNSKLMSHFKRYFMLNVGFFVCSLGVAFMLNSGLGVSPWDVLASGISNTFPISLGRSIVLVSVVIVIASILTGSSIGFGTLLNMLLIGAYVDVILSFNVIQTPENLAFQLLFLLIGTLTLNYGIYLYFSQGLGAGPRDGLMVILARKFNLSVGVTKILIEIVVVAIGYMLGGMFGVGTVMIALFSGPLLNIQQRIIGVDLKAIAHQDISRFLRISKK